VLVVVDPDVDTFGTAVPAQIPHLLVERLEHLLDGRRRGPLTQFHLDRFTAFAAVAAGDGDLASDGDGVSARLDAYVQVDFRTVEVLIPVHGLVLASTALVLLAVRTIADVSREPRAGSAGIRAGDEHVLLLLGHDLTPSPCQPSAPMPRV